MRRAKFGKVRSLTIPNEIIYLICHELPVKSLLKFKCVSKEWNSLVEEDEFIDSHRLRSRTRPGSVRFRKLRIAPGKYGSPVLFIINSDGNLESTGIELDQCRWPQTVSPLLFAKKYWWRRVKQSVLGLVCFGDIILNPSTKEAIKLPDDEDFWGYIPERFRRIDVICHNIGFDSRSKTYKALILFSNVKEDSMTLGRGGGKEDFEPLLLARVLTLGTDSSWRNVNVNIPYEWASLDQPLSYIMVRTSVFVDDQIFFLIFSFYPQQEISKKYRLLVFDVRDEKFRLLRPLHGDLPMAIHIFEFHGRLGMISTVDRSHVWLLEDYENEKWIKEKILSNKHKGSFSEEIGNYDFLISKDVESIFPLKRITTADQHIWRWSPHQN